MVDVICNRGLVLTVEGLLQTKCGPSCVVKHRLVSTWFRPIADIALEARRRNTAHIALALNFDHGSKLR